MCIWFLMSMDRYSWELFMTLFLPERRDLCFYHIRTWAIKLSMEFRIQFKHIEWFLLLLLYFILYIKKKKFFINIYTYRLLLSLKLQSDQIYFFQYTWYAYILNHDYASSLSASFSRNHSPHKGVGVWANTSIFTRKLSSFPSLHTHWYLCKHKHGHSCVECESAIDNISTPGGAINVRPCRAVCITVIMVRFWYCNCTVNKWQGIHKQTRRTKPINTLINKHINPSGNVEEYARLNSSVNML